MKAVIPVHGRMCPLSGYEGYVPGIVSENVERVISRSHRKGGGKIFGLSDPEWSRFGEDNFLFSGFILKSEDERPVSRNFCENGNDVIQIAGMKESVSGT